MATTLSASRADVERRIRFKNEGAPDRRRFVAALKGKPDVYTRSEQLPETQFVASVAVDLSGSMAAHIRSAALYDAMMVLGDTFDMLAIPYEARGFGSSDVQFKAIEDAQFDLQRAAALAELSLGGTSLKHSAGRATSALRGAGVANKLFVALTDGALGDHVATVAVLAEARSRGVVTFGIYLGQGAQQERMDELYGAGNWTAITDLQELPKAVGSRLASLFKRLGPSS